MRNIVIDILVYSSIVKCCFKLQVDKSISGAHFTQNKTYLMKFVLFKKKIRLGMISWAYISKGHEKRLYFFWVKFQNAP